MRPSANSGASGPPGGRRGRRRRHSWTVDLGLALTATIWGLNFTVVKAGLEELSPLAFNALRFPCAAAAVWVLMRGTRRRLLPPRKDWPAVLLLGVVGHVTFQMGFMFGLDRTLTGNAALLLSTSPVWVLVISFAMGRERYNPAVLAGVLATLVGMVILITGGGQQMGAARLGDLLVLGAALSWGAYTVFGRRMVRRRGALQMTAWTLWAGLPFIVGAGIPDLVRMDWGAVSLTTWLGVVYAGVFAIGIAYLLWYQGVKTIGQNRTSVYQNLVPVIALISAWLWLSETPTAQQLLGAVVILAGVVVARRSPKRARASLSR